MMCFNFYSITRAIVKDPEALEATVPMVLKIVFGFVLTMTYTFVGGRSAVIPMQERHNGLRHMMHLFGVNSIEYWLGMLLADWIIILIPSCIYSLLLLAFEDIMAPEQIPEFFLVFLFFGCAMNVLSYLFSHIFKNPETGVQYISVIYVMGFFMVPIMLTSSIGYIATGGDREEMEN